jgi:hypothetical protein
MLGVAAPGVSAELKDPLSPLTSAGGSILCFGRDYSPDHLTRHPKQMTKSVLLAFQQGFADVVLTSRRGAPKRIGAGCGWRKGAGIDTSDRKMIPISTRQRASTAWSQSAIPPRSVAIF